MADPPPQEQRRRAARGASIVAAASALLLLVCCLVAGHTSPVSKSAELDELTKPLPSVQGDSAPTARAGAAKLSQLAMVDRGPGSFNFRVPAGLAPGAHFLVRLPGGGGQIETMTTQMHPGESATLSYNTDGSAQVLDQGVVPAPAQVSPPLPVLAPLSGGENPQLNRLVWPATRLTSEWHNRPNPMADSQASKLATAKWDPARDWTGHRSDQLSLERTLSAKASSLLSKVVPDLKAALHADDKRLHADKTEREELRGQLKKTRKELEMEKVRLTDAWKQGEKELGGRQEAEQRAAHLRKEVDSSRDQIKTLRAEVQNRESDINLLRSEIAAGDSSLAHSIHVTEQRTGAKMRADSQEIASLKEIIAHKDAQAAQESADARELAKTRIALMNSQKDLLKMEKQGELEEMRMQKAKAAVLRMATVSGDKIAQQAQKVLNHEQLEVKAEEHKVIQLKNELSQAKRGKERSKEDKRIKAELHRQTDLLQEEREIEGREETKATNAQRKEAKEAKMVKELDTKLKEERDQSRLTTAEMTQQIKSLRAQAAMVRNNLSKVVLKTNRDALNKVSVESDRVRSLKKSLATLKESKKKQANEMRRLQEDLNKETRRLTDFEEKAENDKLLLREAQEKEGIIRMLREKLSASNSKLQEVEDNADSRADLVKKVKDLQSQLAHHRDNTIQKLRDELTAKESELQAAKEETLEAAKRKIESVDQRKTAEKVSKVLGEEMGLRKEMDKMKARNAGLRDAKEDASMAHAQVKLVLRDEARLEAEIHTLKHKNAKLVGVQQEEAEEKLKEDALRDHDTELEKRLKALQKQYKHLKMAEAAAKKKRGAVLTTAQSTGRELGSAGSNHSLQLTRELIADQVKIGQLESKLQIQKDAETILQNQLQASETMTLENGNQSARLQADLKAVTSLKAELQAAKDKIQQLETDRGEESSAPAAEQSGGQGVFSLQEEEIRRLRKEARKSEASNVKLAKDVEIERDEREVAESKVLEIQRMQQHAEKEMTEDKAKLWASEAKVDSLRHQIAGPAPPPPPPPSLADILERPGKPD